MIIKKVILNNIRSYITAEVNFPEGSSLLSGDIGSGKTSVLLAIEFALFGLQPGQKGASLLRNGSDEGQVFLEIEVDGRKIEIERHLKRGKSVSQSYAAITINGEKEESSVTEIKNKVLNILNYPQEFAKKTNLLYKFTVYTPQEEMKQIILEDAESRLNTLRHIFGIDKYKRIKENTSILTSKLRENIRNKEGIISDLENLKVNLIEKKEQTVKLEANIPYAQREVDLAHTQIKKIEAEMEQIDEKIKQKNKFEQEIEKTKIHITGKREVKFNLEKEKESIILEISEIKKTEFDENKVKEGEIEKENLSKLKEDKNKEYLEVQSKINAINSSIAEKTITKDQITKLDRCPTCLQDVAAVYRANIKNKFESEISQSKNEINELQVKKTAALEQIENTKQKLVLLEKSINDYKLLKVKFERLKEKEDRLSKIQKDLSLIEKDTDMLIKHIDLLKNSITSLQKFENIYIEKEKELGNALRVERESHVKLAEIKKEVDLLKNTLSEIEENIKEKEETKKKLLYLIELEQWLSDKFLFLISFTEKNVLITLREEFSRLFSQWFSMLVSDNFTVRLDDDFTPIVEQQDYQLDYSFLSGGERTAIALAYRLSLNQVINSMLSKIKTKDLVILDEPTDGFSEQQLDKIRDVLDELKAKQLILVSHEQKIEGFVENIIKFRKDEGITKVEV
ncbi:MAG: hypothetical protein ABIH72_00780 [archaeon]